MDMPGLGGLIAASSIRKEREQKEKQDRIERVKLENIRRENIPSLDVQELTLIERSAHSFSLKVNVSPLDYYDEDLQEQFGKLANKFLSKAFKLIEEKRKDPNFFADTLKHRDQIIRKDIENRKPLPLPK